MNTTSSYFLTNRPTPNQEFMAHVISTITNKFKSRERDSWR